MEGIREIARSYYSRASEEEKKSVNDFFERLDVNKDGRISRPELKRSVSACLSADTIFEKLDVNGDGVLDFDEAKCLYYMVNKVDIPRCCGCYDLLVGPYFSCLLCVEKGSHKYDLCCACYRAQGRQESEHEHSYKCMIDNHSLVVQLIKDRNTTTTTTTTPAAAAETITVIDREMVILIYNICYYTSSLILIDMMILSSKLIEPNMSYI